MEQGAHSSSLLTVKPAQDRVPTHATTPRVFAGWLENRAVLNQGRRDRSRNPQPLQVEAEKGFIAGVEPTLRDGGSQL